MAKGKADHRQDKNAHRGGTDKDAVKSPAAERQQERENQAGNRGSGEGKAGFERGDGHPTGR